MVDIGYIYKSLDEIISKCSRSQISNRLNKFSSSEKKELLKGKLNFAEEYRYNLAVNQRDKIYEILDKYKDAPEGETIHEGYEMYNDVFSLRDAMMKRLSRTEDEIYSYEKRILSDYSINNDNVPIIDESKFKLDDNGDRYGVSSSLGELEEAQINLQMGVEYTDFEKDGLSVWWDSGHDDINRSNYGTLYDFELENKKFMDKLSSDKKAISQAIHKSEGLIEPMVMFHGGRFDYHLNPGDHISWKGYVSLSFNKGSAENFDGHVFFGEALYKCYVPAGLKGVCGNDDRLNNFHATEHEYLTDKGLGATIIGIDYDNNIVEVLIDEP